MKKEYKELELEVIRFEDPDIITASGAGCNPDCIAFSTPGECIPVCDYLFHEW